MFATSQAPCNPQQSFAPTPNRFSVLAELEQSPTQMKWAFDLVHPIPKLSRRRGKRAGKHKLKYTSQSNRDAQKNKGLGEICDKIVALSLNSGSTRSEPRDNTTTPMDTVRHHWAPQFRPDKTLEPSVPESVHLQPKPYIPHAKASPSTDDQEQTRQKESRFFPLSAFLASSPPAAHSVPASEPTRPVLTRNSQTKRTFAEAPSTSAQEAVASVCQALAMQRTDTAALEEPLAACVSISSLPSLVAQPSVPACRQRSEFPHVTASSFSPLPITSPHAASPVLTPKVMPNPPSTPSPFRPVDFSPEYILEEPPQPPVADLVTGQDPAQALHHYYSGYGRTCRSSLTTAPFTYPHPFCAPSQPRTTMVPPHISGVARLDEALRWSLFGYGAPQGPLSGTTSSVSVEDFLKMGHASPCWCSKCPNSVPLGELPHEKVIATSQTERTEIACNTLIIPKTFGDEPHEETVAGAWRREPENREIGIGTETESNELVPTSQSSSSSRPQSDFEELLRSVREAFTPDSDNESSEDDTWAVVYKGYPRPQVSMQSSQDTVSEPEIVSEPEVLSLPTTSPAFSETTWTIPPFDFELGSPREELVETNSLTTPSSPLNLWSSPSNSPFLTPVLPSTPPPTSVAPTPNRRTGSAVHTEDILNVQNI
ncbi:uncharacterized protein N0V89_008501 [Didymosphaeria variabile]|uniref:Uncharacterized protein n=1 Tax=Didymosphaeria variabile TaxID=1932322 RepID=A0A9W9C9D2_9PLEO|nr:uncharacterized protein N0V89_008501 [Didymosphaeria variabile]KAJ4349882.1 hypothetical protein N0V89_008501 [Didymosphaeria variabile]